MDRHALDLFCRQHRLGRPAIDAALALGGQRPGAAAWRGFAARLLHAAGLGALGAGVLFFVAANWQGYGVLGRFVLLQSALLACVVVALWRPPPQRLGQSALLLATLLTGGLLALFGQSYQTGADVHELFFTWALLALPFALAGGSGALWALWWCVLNVALALLCGWAGTGHIVWRLLDGHGIGHAALLMLPCLCNLIGAALFAAAGKGGFGSAAPPWLVRLLTSFAFAYGTAAGTTVVFEHQAHRELAQISAGQGAAVLLTFALLGAVVAWRALQQRRDVFDLALIAASWIVISTAWLVETMSFNDVGGYFLVSFWLVATSTGAGLLLMRWVRAWQAPSGAEVNA